MNNDTPLKRGYWFRLHPALWYLERQSLLNALRQRLRRLRQPKYLVGLAFGFAYFYFYVFQFLGRGLMHPGPGTEESRLIMANVWNGFSGMNLLPDAAAALLFLVLLVFAWIVPASRAILAFTEAEIAMLFPAPIRRSDLVAFRLIRSQLGLLIFSVVLTLLSGKSPLAADAWIRCLSWWMLLTTVQWHRLGASFELQRLRERGLSDNARRHAFFWSAALLVGALVAWWHMLPPLDDGGAVSAGNIGGWLTGVLGTGPAPFILFPFKLVVAPLFAHDLAGFASAALPVLVILALHLRWIVRSDIAFEEASLERSKKIREQLDRFTTHGSAAGFRSPKARTPLFKLQPTGGAWLAFLWKYHLRLGGRRYARIVGAAILGALAVAWAVPTYFGKTPGAIATISAVSGMLVYGGVLIGVIAVSQGAVSEFRQALGALDLFRTFPTPGRAIVIGELLGPILAGSIMQWGALAAGSVVLATLPIPRVPFTPGVVIVCLGLMLPYANAALAIIPASMTLMFPAWFRVGGPSRPGLEIFGLRAMVSLGQFLVVALAALPALFFGACAAMAMVGLRASTDAIIATTVAAVWLTFAAELAIAVAWLGTLLDRCNALEEQR